MGIKNPGRPGLFDAGRRLLDFAFLIDDVLANHRIVLLDLDLVYYQTATFIKLFRSKSLISCFLMLSQILHNALVINPYL